MTAGNGRRQLVHDRDITGVYRELGELTATVRELNHSVNNIAQKVDAVAVLASTVDRLTVDQERMRAKLDALESAEERRKGAVGLVEWMSRHWPFILIITAITAIWNWFAEKPL